MFTTMACPRCCRTLLSALIVCPAWLVAMSGVVPAQAGPADVLVPYPTTTTPSAPSTATWVTAPTEPPYADTNVYLNGQPPTEPLVVDALPPDCWTWQLLPEGLIYRSYLAGVHEPRMGIVFFSERDERSLWDVTLGGRVGLVRLGTQDPFHPQGWEIDFEGAAMPRLTLDEMRDLETVDFRAGVPITYGIDNWQFKFGYYHLSSHLGDEFAIAHPGSLARRINYVRDALVAGVSYYPVPAWRLYSEAAYATNADGGAEPWEFQFGTELSRPGPTGPRGTPFLAVNGHIREEDDFSGDVTAQAGWLWRGRSGQVMRLGFHYFNGKSSQYQTYSDSEQQIGFGVWYDF
jgi:hypothetical protein